MKIDPKYLPSRKFLTVLGSIIVVAIVISTVSFFSKNVSKYEPKKNLVADDSKSFEAFKQVDTDGDSVPDWQEVLYGTDPKKADTDGDGTPDNKEIEIDRDPTKANTAKPGEEPNDKIDPKIIANQEKMVAEYEKLNSTQKFSRDFFSNYIATQPAGRQMTEAEKTAFVEKMLLDMKGTNFQDKYSEKDLKISKVENADSVKKYVGEISDIIYKNDIIQNITKGIEIFSTSVEAGKFNKLSDIDLIIKSFTSVSEKIINTETPESFSGENLRLANDLYRLSDCLLDLKEVEKDPIKAITAIKTYAETTDDMGVIINSMTILSSSKSI